MAPIPVREKVLLLKWKMSRANLLDFAIRHELGHAICNDPNEKHADHMAELLAQNKAITCEAPSRRTGVRRQDDPTDWSAATGLLVTYPATPERLW
ncbi:MAG: hypothetical protein ACM3JB_12675 [Acidobacteriaceae bacterium]